LAPSGVETLVVQWAVGLTGDAFGAIGIQVVAIGKRFAEAVSVKNQNREKQLLFSGHYIYQNLLALIIFI